MENRLVALEYEKQWIGLQKDAMVWQGQYDAQQHKTINTALALYPFVSGEAQVQYYLVQGDATMLAADGSTASLDQLLFSVAPSDAWQQGGYWRIQDGFAKLLVCVVPLGDSKQYLASIEDADSFGAAYASMQQELISISLVVFSISFFLSIIFAFRPVKTILDKNQGLTLSVWSHSRLLVQKLLVALCTAPEVPTELAHHTLPIQLDAPIGMFIVQIDQHAVFATLPERERAALAYGIQNVIEEVVGESGNVIGFEMVVGQTQVFLYQGDAASVKCAAQKAQHSVAIHLQQTVTIVFSNMLVAAISLHSLWQAQQQCAKMRLFMGWGAFITCYTIHPEKPNGTEDVLPASMRTQMDAVFKQMRKGEITTAQPLIALLKTVEGRWLAYHTALLQISTSIHQLALAFDSNSQCPIQTLACQFDDCEIVAEIEARLESTVALLANKISLAQAHRQAAYVETIDQLLAHHFSENNFGVQQIADTMQMSSTYLSKLYKETTGVNIMDALSALRMQEAARLVGETKTPLTQVHTLAGYSSVNYFYRVFKKAYTVTPKEYREMQQKRKEEWQ